MPRMLTQACVLVLWVSLASIGGCKSSPATGSTSPEVLSPQDFVSGDPTPAATDTATRTANTTPAPDAVQPATPPSPSPTAIQIVTRPGRPELADESSPVGAPELIDAKVGDINGRPIYAVEFLKPMAAFLRREAERKSPADWLRQTDSLLRKELRGLIADELLQAEALSSLSMDQRLGLRAFLETARGNMISQSRGSEQQARRRIRREQGMSLEEQLERTEEATLVRITLIEKINKRVSVSWRDIQMRYERDVLLYNPPPTARFRLIRVPSASVEQIEQITASLESGKAFAEVAAESPNTFKPDEGGLHTAQFDGEFAAGAFFGAPALNDAARSLEVGGRAGPFEFGNQTGWIELESIERITIPLYDAQVEIEQQITKERRQFELERFIDRLIERARVTNEPEIRAKLLEIAFERFGPKSQ